MAKNSFILYHDLREKIEDLSREQMGDLLKAILDYEIDGSLPEIHDKEVKIAFKFIKVSLDADREKYQETIEKRKKAGAIGGKQRVANQANATFAKQTQANQADTVTVTDTVTVNDITIKEKIYKKEKYSIADIKKVCGQVSPVLLARHNEDNNADYRLGLIHKELVQYMSLEEVEKLLMHSNQTYIVQPKYSNLDLVWVLNNSKKVLQAEPITDIQREEKEEAEYIEDGEHLIFKKTGERIDKATYAAWGDKDN